MGLYFMQSDLCTLKIVQLYLVYKTRDRIWTDRIYFLPDINNFLSRASINELLLAQLHKGCKLQCSCPAQFSLVCFLPCKVGLYFVSL